MQKLKDLIAYFLYRFFIFLFLAIPKSATKKILLGLANLAYKLGKKRRKVCKANLDLVYGDTKSDEQKEEIIKNSYISLLFNMYEFVENQHISNEELKQKVTKVFNDEPILQALKQKRKIIFITAHYGGWEIGVPYASICYKPMVAVVKDMENPYIQAMYQNSRARHNIKMFDKRKSAKELIKGLKDDFALAIMIDQHIDKGCEMEFLGKKDVVIDSASRLALKFDAVIIAGFGVMNDFRDYSVHFYDPIDVKALNENEKNIQHITKLQVKIVEDIILKNPNQWLWQHKRWKKFYGKIYE